MILILSFVESLDNLSDLKQKSESELFLIEYQKSLKRTFKNGYYLQNHPLNLGSSAVKLQRLLCSQKAV